MTCFAPFTGAWIETNKTLPVDERIKFAPFTGAWIETIDIPIVQTELFVRTLYGCVNWNLCVIRRKNMMLFAPFTGAWIETFAALLDSQKLTSHPLRVRELKLGFPQVYHKFTTFAPFTGAWIETVQRPKIERSFSFRTLYGCVNWNMPASPSKALIALRTLYGCVNWNKIPCNIFFTL